MRRAPSDHQARHALVLSGVVAGLLTAVLLTRLVAGLLFGVAAIDRSPSGQSRFC
jgi:hypothetical protein